MTSIDGYYVGYFTGAAGTQGFGMFCLKGGVLVGADMAGVKFDGTYSPKSPEGYTGRVKVAAPPDITLVQGVYTGPNGITYDVDIEMDTRKNPRAFGAVVIH